jgi:hypothetical protein
MAVQEVKKLGECDVASRAEVYKTEVAFLY